MDACRGEGLFQTPGLGDVNKANCKPISSHRSLLRFNLSYFMNSEIGIRHPGNDVPAYDLG